MLPLITTPKIKLSTSAITTMYWVYCYHHVIINALLNIMIKLIYFVVIIIKKRFNTTRDYDFIVVNGCAVCILLSVINTKNYRHRFENLLVYCAYKLFRITFFRPQNSRVRLINKNNKYYKGDILYRLHWSKDTKFLNPALNVVFWPNFIQNTNRKMKYYT